MSGFEAVVVACLIGAMPVLIFAIAYRFGTWGEKSTSSKAAEAWANAMRLEAITQIPTSFSEGEMKCSTGYCGAPALADLLRKAEKAHAEYEKVLGHRDDDWADWYAEWITEEIHFRKAGGV